MESITVDFVLKTPIENILKYAQKKAEKHLNTKMRQIKNMILDVLPNKLYRAITESPEYIILNLDISNSGPLYGGLGLPDLSQKLERIIQHWCSKDNFVIEESPFKFTQHGIDGFLRIKVIKSDFSDVLSLADAKEFVTSRAGHITEINWLEWLLIGGGGYLVRDYVFIQNSDVSPYSRTDTGIMIPKAGSGWQIPMEFMGTQNDNFITRILDQVLNSVTAEIFAKINKYV